MLSIRSFFKRMTYIRLPGKSRTEWPIFHLNILSIVTWPVVIALSAKDLKEAAWPSKFQTLE